MLIPVKLVVLELCESKYPEHIIAFRILFQNNLGWKNKVANMGGCNISFKKITCPEISIIYDNHTKFSSFSGEIFNCPPKVENEITERERSTEVKITLFGQGDDSSRNGSILCIPKRAGYKLFKALHLFSKESNSSVNTSFTKQKPNMLIF